MCVGGQCVCVRKKERKDKNEWEWQIYRNDDVTKKYDCENCSVVMTGGDWFVCEIIQNKNEGKRKVASIKKGVGIYI